MIELTARRRMASSLAAERAAAAAGSERDVLRWSREFFERVHAALLPRTAPVARLPEGELRYFGARALSLWAFVSPLETAIALDHADSEPQIRERARRWLACLTSRTAPGLPGPHWGHPVYGARLDPGSGELDVVWAVPGAWCDAVLAEQLPEREWDAPRSWPRELAGAAG